jgi:ankyrin repeat protein
MKTIVKNTSLVLGVLLIACTALKGAEKNFERVNIIMQGDQKEAIQAISKDLSLIKATDQFGNTLLHTAAAKGYKEAVEFLIKNKANFNALNNKNQTPLMEAINGTALPSIVKLLLQSGAQVNLQDKDGNTALILTAIADNIFEDEQYGEIAQELLDHGADKTIKNKNGETALSLNSPNTKELLK